MQVSRVLNLSQKVTAQNVKVVVRLTEAQQHHKTQISALSAILRLAYALNIVNAS